LITLTSGKKNAGMLFSWRVKKSSGEKSRGDSFGNGKEVNGIRKFSGAKKKTTMSIGQT